MQSICNDTDLLMFLDMIFTNATINGLDVKNVIEYFPEVFSHLMITELKCENDMLVFIMGYI